MKPIIKKLEFLAFMLLAIVILPACKDHESSMDLDGSTWVKSFRIAGYMGDVDNQKKTISVGVPVDADLSAMKVEEIELEAGATSDVKVGDLLNCSVPHSIRITNGDVFTDYTLTVKHDDAEVISASLNGKYTASVNNTERTLIFFVPLDEDVTGMSLQYTLSEGASGNPESGSVLDFSEPVILTVSYRTASIPYTVTVIKDEMSQAPKAFVGMAASVAELSPEAKAAAEWMMSNVPNATYVPLQSVLDNSVKLGDFSMVWAHLDFTDWPGVMWDTRDLFNDYYLKGGCILATRDGARYINDVWRIALDQQSPNNMFGGDSYESLQDDLGFTITGHEDHPLFAGLEADTDGRILLVGKGCQNSNRTLQWCVDWDSYGSMDIWMQKTGATPLASGNYYDPNVVTIAEFLPAEILSGYTSGTVITIGTPGFEWFGNGGLPNPYEPNIIQLTKNAINYLCK